MNQPGPDPIPIDIVAAKRDSGVAYRVAAEAVGDHHQQGNQQPHHYLGSTELGPDHPTSQCQRVQAALIGRAGWRRLS